MAIFIKEVDGAYPIYDYTIRASHPNVSFGPTISTIAASALGYFSVEATDKPDGDVVVEAKPTKVDGAWKQVWEVRQYSPEEVASQLAELKANMVHRVEVLATQALTAGAEFDFGSEDAPDAGRVGMSDGDRVNILGLKQAAERAIAESDESPIFIRCVDNTVKMMTPQQTIAMSWAVYYAYTAVMAASWGLQQQISEAATVQDLPQLPTQLV